MYKFGIPEFISLVILVFTFCIHNLYSSIPVNEDAKDCSYDNVSESFVPNFHRWYFSCDRYRCWSYLKVKIRTINITKLN